MSGHTAKTTATRDVLTNLMGLVLIVILLGLGVAYGLDALSRADTAKDARQTDARLPVNVAGVALDVPVSNLKSGDLPGSAFADRLDLVLTLDLGDGQTLPVDLTLVPKARARASAALLDSVYLKHFTSAETHGAPGLVGKPLAGGDGYDGETVWYDPISIDPFAAKCAAPVSEDAVGVCMRTLVLDSGLSAILGFSESALRHWRQFDPPLKRFLYAIGAGAPIR